MLYIFWKDDNNIGVPIIDEQHRGIVSIINSFYYFMQKGSGHEAIRPTLSMLEQYTFIHFTTEENIISKSKYPDTKNHIELHRKLEDKLKTFTRGFNLNENPDEILRFLKAWWIGHILNEDKAYIPYIENSANT